MIAKFKYNLSAENAEEVLNKLRCNANEKAERKIAEANAFREGYITAILDVQDRIIRSYITNDGGAEG